MNIIKDDQTLMDMAKHSAISFCRNYHPWGMDVDDVLSRIFENYALRESEIVCYSKDAPERKVAARIAIAYALNACRDESKANRARLQPYQIRKALANGTNIDQSINQLGNDMRAWYQHDNLSTLMHHYLEIALRYMQPNDAAICRTYLKLGSWEAVAKKFGYSNYSFYRHILPGLTKRARAVWKKVW